MTVVTDDAIEIAVSRLARCYSGDLCDWLLFRKPEMERANFASRYHLVYPALGYFIQIQRDPAKASILRSQLDTMYRGLLERRCWDYWHRELEETTWPLQERNLTYAGRLATFIGFYIAAFGEPPAEHIEIDGRSTTYSALSRSLWQQMRSSPNCGVSCYHHESMVMCNAHMLINNVLHDRLFGTDFVVANDDWFKTIDENLLRDKEEGPLFYYGTESNKATPITRNKSLGADIWSLFLMSAIVPDRVADWFEGWQKHIVYADDVAHVEVAAWEKEQEFSSNELATAWAYCLARELGQAELAERLRRFLAPKVERGFERDPYISGLFLLGTFLERGQFRRLVAGNGN